MILIILGYGCFEIMPFLLSVEFALRMPLPYATGLWERCFRRCIHHFKSDLINNMDHMHISGTEPSSVILSKTK